jgi:hypothetical protein
MEVFSVKEHAGDGNCLFSSLTISLKNDESHYDALRHKNIMHVC